MSKQIFDLTTLKINDVVRIISKQKGKFYSIIKSIKPVENETVIADIAKRVGRDVKSGDFLKLDIVDLSVIGGTWDITIPVTTQDSFVSPNDSSFEITIFISSMKEAEECLRETKNAEIENIFKKVVKDVKVLIKI